LNLLETFLAKEEQKELAKGQQKAWNKKDLHKKKNPKTNKWNSKLKV